MDLTEGSKTSAKLNLTPGKNPKGNIQVSEHGENLKSRRHRFGPSAMARYNIVTSKRCK
jgi:hypothetical protein